MKKLLKIICVGLLIALILMPTDSSCQAAFSTQRYNISEHIFYMEPNVIINQTLHSLCLNADYASFLSLNVGVGRNQLDLQNYPSGIIRSHYFEANRKIKAKSQNKNDECEVFLIAERSYRIKILFKEFYNPSYRSYPSGDIKCDDTLTITEAQILNDQEIAKEVKLCGNSLNHLSIVSLNYRPYWLSSSNVILIRWKRNPNFSNISFKAIYTIFKSPNVFDKCDSGFTRCTVDTCIPTMMFCSQIKYCDQSLADDYSDLCADRKMLTSNRDNTKSSILFIYFNIFLFFLIA